MTPEEQLLLLKGLLGRIRSNAGERLPGSGTGEDEFLRRSELDARELEETQEGSAALRAAAAEADLAARAAARGAVEHLAPPARAGSNGVSYPPPPAARPLPAPLELDLFDPFEDDSDRVPDTSHDRGGGDADFEIEVDGEVEEGAFEDAAMDDDDSGPDLETNRPPPRGGEVPAPPPSSLRIATGWTEPPPAAISRIVATGAPGPYPDLVSEDRDEGHELELAFDEPEEDALEPPPRRALDSLAQTAQNPTPAAMFERAILEEADEPGEPSRDQRQGVTLAAMERGEQRQTSGVDEVEKRGPFSSRRPVDLDQPVDLGLESEPPPESGEMASQRQPATGSLHALVHDLDAVTPHADEGERIAKRLRATAAEPAPVEMMPAASPRVGPVIVGRVSLAAATFVEVLDAALAFGEAGG